MTFAPLTGPKVFAITAAFFAVVIGVNLTLAFQAINTFPGLEVANGYIASQTFDAERSAQNALGWTLNASVQNGAVTLAFVGPDGLAVKPDPLNAVIGRATEGREDGVLAFSYANGVFTAPAMLNPGKWVVHIDAVAANGTPFRRRIALFVKG